MMPEAILGGALLAGLAAGGVFYGGLWLGVTALPRARHPVALVLGSFVLRAAVVLAVLWALAAVSPAALVAGCAGLLASRLVVMAVTRRDAGQDRRCT
ncbi:MAG: ATP synthase subunit I [Gammaproteobacteria bacterium]|nr:ATP synthase subunit I [Gammaproteobacteria bacterium]